MKQEDQLIALFEWMGWRWFRMVDTQGVEFHQFVAPNAFSEKQIKRYGAVEVKRSDIPDEAETLSLGLPNLTLDLMHNAEKKLSEDEAWAVRDLLQDMVIKTQPEGRAYLSTHFLYGATKEQHLEALLRAVGKYIEPPNTL